MTDFSHLHELEERAVRIRERMSACRNNDTQWKAQAVQLFQTEQEIADEREFLGLEDMDVDDLYAALFDEQESNVVREITKTANEAEQAVAIRTAAEALVARLDKPFVNKIGIWDEYTALKAALSRGWLAKSRNRIDDPVVIQDDGSGNQVTASGREK